MSYYLLDGITEVRNFTGITDNSMVSDDQIEFYIENNESLIFTKVGFPFVDTEITEYYDGDDTKTLKLRRYPVRSVSSIKIYSANDDIWTEVISSCYIVYAEKGVIFYKDSIFPYEPIHKQNIEVKYTYGMPIIQDTYKFKVARSICLYSTAIDVLQEAGNKISEGLGKEKLGEYTLDFGTGGPYGRTIQSLQEKIKECYDALGSKIGIEVI
jgi:hypothetical protein